MHAAGGPGSVELSAGSAGMVRRKVWEMPTWLLILVVGVVLLVLGVAVEAAKLLIWIGVAVLVVSLILGLVGRGRKV